MIKELNELAWLVSQGVDRAEEHLSFLCKNRPEILNLYRAVRDHDYRTDEEAIRGANIGERTSYKKYGKMLVGHLYQLVFFLARPNDVYTRTRNDGFRALSILKLTEYSSCKHAARQTALDLLEKGLENDRPEWVVEATRSLMDATSVARDKLNEFEQYAALFGEYKSYLDWELKANLYFDEKRLNFARKKGFRAEVVQHIEASVEELQKVAFKIPSVTFNLCYSLMACDRYFLTGNHHQAIKVLDEAIQYFRSRPSQSLAHLHILFYRKVMCFNELGLYDEGHQTIQQCLDLTAEGTINWYAILEIEYYLCMHAGRYDKALEVYRTAVSHKRFAAQREAAQELWNILGVYVFLAYRLTQSSLPEKGLPRFRASKFLNEVPVFSQDKNGMNVAILVAHVLLQLVEGRTNDVYDRVEALEKYRERYLRGVETERSQCFIKILVAMARADFRRTRFEQKVSVLLRRLQEVVYDSSNQPFELEIIPYLNLYDLILNFLPPRAQLGREATLL